MVVSGSSTIVTGEHGEELDNSIRVGFLDASQGRVIQIADVIRVAVTSGHQTRVDTRGVAVPDVPKETHNRLACLHVDELTVQDNGHAGLVLAKVGPN